MEDNLAAVLHELIRDSEADRVSLERRGEVANALAMLLQPSDHTPAAAPPMFLAMDVARTSLEAAEWWSNAPKTVRAAVIRHAAGHSIPEHSANVASIARSIVTLARWADPTSALTTLLRKINKNHAELKGELTAIRERLDRIEAILIRIDQTVEEIRSQLDENILSYAYTGVSHLERALNSHVTAARNNDLSLANADFSRLLVVPPERRTRGFSADMPNDALIAIGHWGLSIYYSLMEDQISALRQVYECGERCPDFAPFVFGPGFFSRDFAKPMQEARAAIKEAQGKLADIAAHNRKAKWKGVAETAGVHALGLALGAIAGSIGTIFGMTLPAGGMVYLQFVRSNPVHPDYKDVTDAVNALTAATERLEKERSALRDECAERLKSLTQRDIGDLLASTQQFGT